MVKLPVALGAAYLSICALLAAGPTVAARLRSLAADLGAVAFAVGLSMLISGGGLGWLHNFGTPGRLRTGIAPPTLPPTSSAGSRGSSAPIPATPDCSPLSAASPQGRDRPGGGSAPARRSAQQTAAPHHDAGDHLAATGPATGSGWRCSRSDCWAPCSTAGTSLPALPLLALRPRVRRLPRAHDRGDLSGGCVVDDRLAVGGADLRDHPEPRADLVGPRGASPCHRRRLDRHRAADRGVAAERWCRSSPGSGQHVSSSTPGSPGPRPPSDRAQRSAMLARVPDTNSDARGAALSVSAEEPLTPEAASGLQRWLASRLPGGDRLTITSVSKPSSGFSAQTWLIDLADASAATSARRVRRPDRDPRSRRLPAPGP